MNQLSQPGKPSQQIIDIGEKPMGSQEILKDASVSPIVREYVGNLPFEQRNAILAKMAQSAGLRLPDTRVPAGDSLLPIGVEAQRRLKGEIDALPTLGEGVVGLYKIFREENPKDVEVPIQRVRMDAGKGGLYGDQKMIGNAFGYTPTGFGHVLDFMKPAHIRGGFSQTILALPPGIRSEAFNYFASTAIRPMQNEVVLRTLRAPVDGGGGRRRVIRAVTSQRYANVSDVDLVGAIQAAVPDGAKLRVTRDLDRTDIEIIWPTLDRQLQVGDIALVTLRIVNSETKQSSIKIMPQLLRVLCYNFTTAYSDGGDEEITIRHVGEVKQKLAAAFARGLAVIEPFAIAFGDAYKNPLPMKFPTRGEVLERVGKVFKLPESTLEFAAKMWDADGSKSAGDTLAGLANSLTRASQEATMEKSETIEKAAGKLIMKGWDALLD